jgi:glucosamine-6-phosphate deaminase
MRLIPATDDNHLAEIAADLVSRHVAEEPDLVLTTPTGRTPIGLYRRLRSEAAAGRIDLEQATVFMLDEYLDLPGYPAGSFQAFLREHLGPLVFNGRTTVHTIKPSHANAAEICANYDRLLDESGGIDLAILGMGGNGHVGFNEPGATDDQRTHQVLLSEDTLQANFPGVEASLLPSAAVTIGLADLRAARSVLLLASGQTKAKAVAALCAGARIEESPVTHLLDHPDFTVVADQALLPAS